MQKIKAGHIRQNNHHSLEPIIFKDDEFDAVIKVNVAPYKALILNTISILIWILLEGII
jgi:hypothetical protein